MTVIAIVKSRPVAMLYVRRKNFCEKEEEEEEEKE